MCFSVGAFFVFFFFQAEDGIRDDLVTGVQTCALPIYVVIAYVGALFALLVLYTIGWLGETVQGGIGAMVRYASITEHFQELTKGIVHTKDLVYFATLLVVPLFLTQRSVESVRW